MPLPLFFVSPDTFEPWDYRNPDTKGIGGSETAQIEMAWRMARRGYPVMCYAPIPEDCQPSWRGTTWKHWKDADTSALGVWVLSRCPSFADNLKGLPLQRIWLVCQDMDYPGEHGYTQQRMAKFERVIALCPAQANLLRQTYPWMADRIVVSTNGVKLDLLREVEAEGIPRDPHRLFYGSSPDRGLLPLLKIFRRAKEWVPDLTLEVAYGFDNIDKILAKYHRHPIADFKAEVMEEADQPGVTWLGRLPQREVARRLFGAGLWVYPFTAPVETSCVACMEAQACGAIPIVSPLHAVGENVMHGSHIPGDPMEPIVFCRFVDEIRYWADPKKQEEARPDLMRDARRIFNWERVCDHYEHWIAGKSGNFGPVAQYAFQHRHAVGRILNVGCAEDSTGFLLKGALNIDIADKHPNGTINQAHMLADACDLPTTLYHRFDTVILGDILEHMDKNNRQRALTQARACMVQGGKVIVTWPEDARPEDEQRVHGEYAPGLPAFHPAAVTLEEMREDWKAAGLAEAFVQPLDYSFAVGHGVILQ